MQRRCARADLAVISLTHTAALLSLLLLCVQTLIVIADTQSIEKKNTLRWGGATLLEVPAVPFKNPVSWSIATLRG